MTGNSSPGISGVGGDFVFVKTHGKQKKEGLFGEMKAIKDFGEQGLFLIPPKGISWKNIYAGTSAHFL